MVKRRVDKEIGEYEHARLGITVPLYLTPDNRFTAEYANKKYYGKDTESLEKLLAIAISETAELEFFSVIEIETKKHMSYQSSYDVYIGFSVDRFHIAEIGPKENIKMLRVEWDELVNPMTHARSFHRYEFESISELPWINTRYDATYLMIYTEQLWTALERLRSNLQEAQAKLEELLGTSEGWLKLTDIGHTLLLSLPSGDSDKGPI